MFFGVFWWVTLSCMQSCDSNGSDTGQEVTAAMAEIEKGSYCATLDATTSKVAHLRCSLQKITPYVGQSLLEPSLPTQRPLKH